MPASRPLGRTVPTVLVFALALTACHKQEQAAVNPPALVAGRVPGVKVEVGDEVRKGQTLIELDSEDYRLRQGSAQYAARFYNNPEMLLNVAVEQVQGVAAELLPLGYSIRLLGSAMIGLVLLVAKNSILLVDLTNRLRAQGKSIEIALREACPVRLRPVLMTSLTVILAMLPTAFGVGAGSATNGPLAVAVIGGMVSSTLLTLVVPVVYALVESGVLRLRARRAAGLPASA